jgi:HPt (histidine-containing phosphotransfer) domain-containing protein
MTQPEVIDRAVLKDLLATTGNDSAFLAELIDTYLEDAADLLAAMAQAVSNDDPESLQRAAHSLKSNSASLGARGLASLCQQVEQQARDGLLGPAAERVTSIEVAFVEVERELRLLRPC